MTDETRVGYATIDILFKETEQYIRTHTVDNKYIGRLDYLNKYQQMNKYLNDKGE